MKFGVLTLPNNSNKLLIYGLIAWIMFEDLMIDTLGAPSVIRYFNDTVVLLLLVTGLMNVNRILQVFREIRYRNVLLIMLLYMVYTLFGSMINGVPMLQVLWAIRNNYRFLAFFILCVYALDSRDLERLLRWLCQLQWVNLALGLFEFFVLHQKRDYLGGMFGTAKGGNASLNVYLCFVMTYVVLQYIYKQKSFCYLLLSLTATMVLAGLAELKVIFVEIVLIVILVLLLVGRKKQVVAVLGISLVALAIGLMILKQLFPDHFALFTNFSGLLEYGTREDGGYSLSRFRAFSNINRLFFKGSVLRNAFGFGFGNCEYSAYNFLTSNFYRQFGGYNYRWFAHQMMFLETGYVGFILYIAILGGILFSAWESKKRNPSTVLWNNVVLIMGVITIINLWYNASIRSEIAYLTYFALSVGAIVDKKMDNKKRGLIV